MIQWDHLNGIRFQGRPYPTKAARLYRPLVPCVRRFGEPDDEVDPFQSWTLARAGLDPQNYRGKPLRRRLPACLRALKSQDCEQARSVLENEPGRLATALDSLLIGVTEFFRDDEIFRFLEGNILREVLRQRGGIRVWSAGCSNGCELGSVAIMLAEAGILERCELLGTDCRPGAILEAREALYHESCLKNASDEIRRKYFRRERGCHRFLLSAEPNISWAVSDLFGGVPEGLWDLILCRNVAIYLGRRAADELWRIMGGALAAGGHLVTGKAERPSLPFSQVSRSIYKKTGAEQDDFPEIRR